MIVRLMILIGLAAGLAACRGMTDLPFLQASQPAPEGGAGNPQAVPGERAMPGEVVPPVATPLYGEVGTPQAVTLEVKVIEESAEAPAYRIQARYPYLTGSGSPYLAAFNQYVEAQVLEVIGQFVQETATSSSGSSLLQIDFLPTLLNTRRAAVLLKVTTYLPGAAHIHTTSRAINYDLQNGQPITLADLFRPGAPYLQTLSALSIQDLRERQLLGWEEGALPREENFQTWNLTPEGLLITFDEYRVASYTAGPQAVLIPYERLSDIADPDGPMK
jgi:hypothetical protein